MQLHFQLTEPEYLAAQRLFAHKSTGARRSHLIVGLFIALLLVGVAAMWNRGQLLPGVAANCVALPLLLLIAMRVVLPRMIRRAWQDNQNLQSPIVVDCDPEGIVIRTTGAVDRVPYADIRDWIEDEQLVLLARNTSAFHLLPKRAFAAPGDVATLEGWFRQAKGELSRQHVAPGDSFRQAAAAASEGIEQDASVLWSVNFQLDDEDAAEAAKLCATNMWRGPVGVIFKTSMLFLSAYLVYGVYQQPALLQQTAIAYIGLAVLFVAILWLFRRQDVVARRQRAEFRSPMAATLRRDSLWLQMQSGWQRINLADKLRFVENNRLILLLEANGVQHVLPKRAFASDDQIAVLRQLVAHR